MTEIIYATRAKSADLPVFFVAEGDIDMNIHLEAVRPANPTCNGYSIAKAYTGLAVGILYDRGLLKPESRALDFLSDLAPATMDDRWREVTVADLLRHRSGLGRDVLDIDSNDASTFPAKDYLKVVLSEPLAYQPGTVYKYTDAGYYLLSRVVAHAGGEDVLTMLRPILMGKMNFKELAWSTCPQGYCMGATGLYTRTEDMIKLAILYLRGGDWSGERIVSEEWVDMVLSRGYEIKPKGGGWYGKGGMRGQMMAFSPEERRAVAWHSFGVVPFETMMGLPVKV